MEWLKRPAIEFEEIEVIRDDNFVGWQAGSHRWLPATLKCDLLELKNFFYNSFDNKQILDTMFNDIVLESVIKEGDEYLVNFTFKHATFIY